MKILVNYDFLGSQIENAVIHAASSAPEVMAAGQLYFNTVEQVLYVVKEVTTPTGPSLQWEKAGVVYESANDLTSVITGLSADGTVTRTAIGDLIISNPGEGNISLREIFERVEELEAYMNRQGVHILTPAADVDDATALGGIATPKNMDIAMIKRIIAGTTGKYEITTYVYDGSLEVPAWRAADGSYNAENVYFDEDLVYTANIGVKTVPASGSGTITAAGKNVSEVLKSILASEKNPTKTNPSCTVTLTGGNKSLEVGSKVTPSYTTTFNPGSYSYGPATGITAETYNASFNGESLSTNSGTFSEYTVTESTKKVSLSVSYTEGAVPKTNIGNEYAAGKIAAGSCSATSAHSISGYRNMFYGPMNGGTYTSASIRALANKKASGTGNLNTFGVTGVAGADRVVVAIPEARSITKVIMPSALNADATSNFVLQSERVSVEGANGFAGVNYKVYVYQPAALASDMTFTVTIG